MNKLYILGALALSNVDAYCAFSTAGTAPTQFYSYTYTATADCFVTATATTLGLGKIYYQYYTFTMAAGTVGYTTYTIATGVTVGLATYAYVGCTHTHLYNWMAQPAIGTNSVIAGLGDSAVAYGYAMSGTAVTACTAVAIVTSTLFTSSIFKGAKYQSVSAIVTPQAATAASTVTSLVGATLGNSGLNNLYCKTGITVSAYSNPAPASDGIATTTGQNAYWDFLQTNVFMGQTQFGRGGGASTSPCGWWTVYTNEAPGPNNVGGGTGGLPTTTWNLVLGHDTVNVHMWTDNALVSSLSAFGVAFLASVLY